MTLLYRVWLGEMIWLELFKRFVNILIRIHSLNLIFICSFLQLIHLFIPLVIVYWHMSNKRRWSLLISNDIPFSRLSVMVSWFLVLVLAQYCWWLSRVIRNFANLMLLSDRFAVEWHDVSSLRKIIVSTGALLDRLIVTNIERLSFEKLSWGWTFGLFLYFDLWLNFVWTHIIVSSWTFNGGIILSFTFEIRGFGKWHERA